MDGATAYLLIQRHADNWADAAKMMGEWLDANQRQRFDAADMATAAAQGFRDGVSSVSAVSESVANNRPSLEEVFRRLSDRAYCNYIEQMRRDACLGWEHKAAHGKFGEAELRGHTIAGEMLGRHKAFAEAANALRGSDAPLTYPSPPAGMAGGWISVEDRLPKLYTEVLIHPRPTAYCCEGEVDTQGRWSYGEYETGFGHHQIACEVTHWMPLPPPPTTSAGSGKGE